MRCLHGGKEKKKDVYTEMGMRVSNYMQHKLTRKTNKPAKDK